MMSAVCTINTQIGTAMEEAHLKCAAAAQVEERKKKKNKNKKKNKGKNKGKGKKCDVDLDVLDEFFAGVWEKKACILKEVGWVSQDGNIMPDSIMAGINTLDPRMSEGLADTNELCSAQAGNVTIENMFSGEEFVEVEIQAEKTPVTADVHCNFMTACGNFILDQMGEMVRYMTEGGFTSLS